MNFLKKLFPGQDRPVNSYADFWAWFRENEAALFKSLSTQDEVDKKFLGVILPKLQELRAGFWLLAGMENDTTAELIVTADGAVNELVFVEELIAAAPDLPNWKFTAHKPMMNVENVSIKMGDLEFYHENLSFYASDEPAYPDNIDITVVHPDLNKSNRKNITTGVLIYLDNYLGELNMVTKVDHVAVVGVAEAGRETIPMAKLREYINWREKEFLEKYEGRRHDTQHDEYASMEATDKQGNPVIATMNDTLLHWDAKASHPWRMDVTVPYDGSANGGMPDRETYAALNGLEDEIMAQLRDEDGYLNVGRETGGGKRVIYFACTDFRHPAKVMDAVQKQYASGGHFDLSFDIFKDKYWRSLEFYANAN